MEEGSLMNGNGVTREIVAKLWNLCNILRDDGITYTDYVTELTFLLFLKMLAETGHEERLPAAYRWAKLDKGEGIEQLEYYRQLLLDLGNPKKTKDQVVLAIFTDAQTKLRKPTNLKALSDAIDKLDWFSAREEGLGNMYEGLLEKNAAEKKSGAGQYFTPRPLIDCIVRILKVKICLTSQAYFYREGIKEVDDGIWLVSFMDYDLGYIDLEEKTLQPLNNPFGPKVLPMS
ncbi:MAG TPA: N-6 DNA methylase [Bryobacteraceae bacterium]|nr:N-6 DNA methylase [Bryobacteraceae bacterium]